MVTVQDVEGVAVDHSHNSSGEVSSTDNSWHEHGCQQQDGVRCGTRVLARWLQIAIALCIDKELERGSMHGILQIVGEEVEPGEGK